MMKRQGNFQDKDQKKPKIAGNDPLWDDDDLNMDEIEDCFLRASQVAPHNPSQNESILPNYTVFKGQATSRFFVSTQLSQLPSTSSRNVNIRCEIKEPKATVKELEDKCKEKDGEIAVLRSNLNKLRAQMQDDLEKHKAEFDAVVLREKGENKAMKSQLEFKNLEIANLRQQIGVSRLLQKTQSEKTPPVTCASLKGLRPMCQQFVSQNRIYVDSSDQIMLKKWPLLEDCDYSKALSFVVGIDASQIESDEVIACFKSAFCLWSKNLDEFYKWLSVKNASRITAMQLTMGHFLHFLSDVLPFSNFLQRKLVQSPVSDSNSFLHSISVTISKIGSDFCSHCEDFFKSLLRLFSRCFDCCNDQLNDFTMNTICREILFTRPSLMVVGQLLVLFKVGSRNLKFVDLLCSRPTVVGKNVSKGSCLFNLLWRSMAQLKGEETTLFERGENVLCLGYNIFKANPPWLFQDENTRCECLTLFCRLQIRTIYKLMEHSSSQSQVNQLGEGPIRFFRLSVKIMSLLTFNYFDLIQKDITDIAQYKDIVSYLGRIRNQLQLSSQDLRKLNGPDEETSINVVALTELDF